MRPSEKDLEKLKELKKLNQDDKTFSDFLIEQGVKQPDIIRKSDPKINEVMGAAREGVKKQLEADKADKDKRADWRDGKK